MKSVKQIFSEHCAPNVLHSKSKSSQSRSFIEGIVLKMNCIVNFFRQMELAKTAIGIHEITFPQSDQLIQR